MTTVGQFLKDARERANLSQKRVTQDLGLTTPQYCSNWERSVSYPSPWVLKKICKMYGLVYKDVALDVVNQANERNLDSLKKRYQ